MMVNQSNPYYTNPGVLDDYAVNVPIGQEYNITNPSAFQPGAAPVLSFPSETNPMQPLGQGMDSSGMFPVQASGDLDTDFPSGAFATPPSTDSLKQFPFTDKNMTPQGPNPQAGLPMPPQGPALSNPAQPQPQAPALSVPSQGATGNARGSSRMPNQKIGLGEAMMRMGGATMAASSQGALAGLGAMTDSYGQIQDYNRAREMEAFQIEEARRQAIADRQARAQAAAAKADKGDPEASAKARLSLQNADAVLQGFDDFDGVTGWGYWFNQTWDRLTGNERENIRLKINSMKVDRVLANIAQTKGAISEKEMDIFMSDQPAWTASEDIWRKWVTDYRNALLVMNTNLANGTTVGSSNKNDIPTFDPATGKFSDEG